jgi:hypothetical protein
MKNNEEKNLKLLFVLFYLLFITILSYVMASFPHDGVMWTCKSPRLGKEEVIIFARLYRFSYFFIYFCIQNDY